MNDSAENRSGGGMLNSRQQDFFNNACGAENVKVFREGHDESIQYTVFFEKDGNEWRIDFVEPLATFNAGTLSIEYGGYQEWYMVGRVVEMINQGDYVRN